MEGGRTDAKIKARLERYLKNGGSLGSLAKTPRNGKAEEPFPCEPAKVFAIQRDALAKRLKAIGVKDVVIGISGGLDSTLCLLVACAAFDKLKLPRKGIHVYTMPGFGTSKRTKGNADRMCEGLGLELETISIVKSVKQHLKDIGHDGTTPDVTYENAQARMRTMILMDKANMTGGIVLGTGDMSEIALGWCTYNGDHMSMFGVNAGVPKTVVRKVCEWWAGREKVKGEGQGQGEKVKGEGQGQGEKVKGEGQESRSRGEGQGEKVKGEGQGQGERLAAEAILDVCATPVSPELVKGQVTEDKIGPYELHDFFLWNFCRNGLNRTALYDAAAKRFRGVYPLELIGRTLDTFLWRILAQAFKRNCAPDGIRVFDFDFSRDGWWVPSDIPAGWL